MKKAAKKKTAELIEQEMDVCEDQDNLDLLDQYHKQVVNAKRELSAKKIKDNTEAYVQLSKSFNEANKDLKKAIGNIEKIGKRTERIGKIIGQICKATAKAIEIVS